VIQGLRETERERDGTAGEIKGNGKEAR